MDWKGKARIGGGVKKGYRKERKGRKKEGRLKKGHGLERKGKRGGG